MKGQKPENTNNGKSKTDRPRSSMAIVLSDLPPTVKDLLNKTRDLHIKEKKEMAEEYYRKGHAYESGREIPPAGNSDVFARAYYEAGAKLGSLSAKSALGVFHAQGRGGLPPRDQAAVAEYHAAADGGDLRAKRNLALHYSTGRGGLYQDTEKAYVLLAEVEDPHRCACFGKCKLVMLFPR